MASNHYEPLSAQDRSFLAFDVAASFTELQQAGGRVAPPAAPVRARRRVA